MLSIPLAVVALVASAFAVSGCGGSSNTASTAASTGNAITTTNGTSSAVATPQTLTTASTVATGKPLTKAQWIVRGDRICARLLTELSAQSAKTQEQLVQAFTQAVAYERSDLISLAKLAPPNSKRNDWQQYLSGFQEMMASSVAGAEAAQAGNFAINSPLVIRAQAIKERIDAVAKRDGFKRCSRL